MSDTVQKYEGKEITVLFDADGPLIVHGDFTINGEAQTAPHATLCRCGASKSRPYCDGSHATIGFSSK